MVQLQDYLQVISLLWADLSSDYISLDDRDEKSKYSCDGQGAVISPYLPWLTSNRDCAFEASKDIRDGNDMLEPLGARRDLTPRQVSIEMLTANETEQGNTATLVHCQTWLLKPVVGCCHCRLLLVTLCFSL